MCQLQSNGGRRCPVHLESTRFMIAKAREYFNLSIRQMQIVFAEARSRQPVGWTYDDDLVRARDYDFLQSAIPELGNTTLEESQIDDRSLKAYLSMEAIASRTELAQYRALRAVAGTSTNTGSVEEAEARFMSLLHRFERHPAERDSIGVTMDEANDYITQGILPHPATLAAYKALINDLPLEVPPVLEGDVVNILEETNGQYASIAWDGVSNQVVLVTNGVEQPTYYRNVSREAYEHIIDPQNQNPLQSVRETLVWNPDSQYLNAEEALNDRVSVRCEQCGQFMSVNNGSHSCPERVIQQEIHNQGMNYENFSPEELAILEDQYRSGVPADDIISAFLPVSNSVVAPESVESPELPSNEPVVRGFEGAPDENLTPELSMINANLAVADGSLLHRAKDSPAYTQFRWRLLETPVSANGIEVHKFQYDNANEDERVTAINTTTRSQFLSYVEENTLSFVNQDDANNAAHDPANNNRVFIHVLKNNGERYFLGTLPRGTVIRRIGTNNRRGRTEPTKVSVRQRFNETLPSQLRLGPDSEIEFNNTPEGARYEQARQGVDWESLEEETSQVEVLQPNSRPAISKHHSQFDSRMVHKNFMNAIESVRENQDGFFQGGFKVRLDPRSSGIRFTDQQGRIVDLNRTDGTGNVTFNALIYKQDDKGLVVDTGKSLKCDCEQYANTYYCNHINFVNATLPTTVTDIAMQSAEYSPYVTSQFDEFRPVHNNLQARDLNPFHDAFASTGLSITKKGNQLRLATKNNGLTSSSRKALIQHDIAHTLNNSGLTIQEKIRELTGHMNGDVHDFTTKRHLKNILESPDTVFIFNTQVRGSRHAVPITLENGSFRIQREAMRCTECGRFMNEGGCTHTELMTSTVDTMEQLYNRRENESELESEQIGISDIEYKAQVNEAVRALRNEEIRESRIQGVMLSREMTRTEAIEYVDSVTILPHHDLIAAAQTLIDQRAEHSPRLAAYRDNLNHERAIITDSLETIVGEERATRIRENNFNRAVRWRESDPVMTAAQANEIVQSENLYYEAYPNPETHGVTDGICDPSSPSPLGFGVEIEFEFSRRSLSDLEDIQNDLYRAGLTTRDTVGDYHRNAANNWDGFNIEYDDSCDGELVTPILYDTPEDWEKLGQAIEILKRHGARATESTGGHVNISTHNIAGNNAKLVELSRTFMEHQNAMFVLASNPTERAHRGTEYCYPLVDSPMGDVRIDHKQITRHHVHNANQTIAVRARDIGLNTPNTDPRDYPALARGHSCLNLGESTGTSENSRAEFRLWDGTLDLRAIQSHVAISAALVDYADRKIEEEGVSQARTYQPGYPNHLPVNEQIDSAVHLANKIFRRTSDRERLMSLLKTSLR